MKTINKQIKFFKENGYLKININKSKFLLFKKYLADLIEKYYKKYVGKKIPKKNRVNFLINRGLIELDKKDHKYLVEIYNQIPTSTIFFNIINDEKLIKTINHLMKRESKANLLINSHSLRMDIPGITPFVYGWHQDSKSNLPNSKFIQAWMPAVTDITSELGGLYILEKSFKYNNIKTTHNIIEKKRLAKGKPIRASHDVKLLNFKNFFKEKILSAKLGSVILFNNKLMHKSGVNKSKNKMRYVINCFYHDLSNPKMKYLDLNQKKINLKY